MTRRFFGIHLTMCASILIGIATSDARSAEPSSGQPQQNSAESVPKPLKIDKLYFMFHPVCWRRLGPNVPGGNENEQENWTACYERELRVNKKQKELMSRMKPNEVLVLFPIGNSEPMQDLENHATKTLGRRVIIVERGAHLPPAWLKTPNLIERFLNDPKLPGRDDFLRDVPAQIQTELEAEIRSAWKARRSDWNPSVLKVVYYSRLSAMDIVKELEQRNLQYDPAAVQSEAFGEGFAQCAMTWKQMLVPYMGLAHPAENDFDLSVSGAPFLVNAKLKERIKLSDDIRLFLWEGDGSKKIGMYTRAWCRLKDPQLYAHIPLKGISLVVREVHDKQCWPNPAGPEMALKEQDGHLKVPIYNGIRRDFDWRNVVRGVGEDACYVIADDISMNDFRDRLVSSHRSE